MHLDSLHYPKQSESYQIAATRAIEDEDAYRAAIKILDRLFVRDDTQTPEELEYFRMLAEMACEYEMTRGIKHSPF